MLSLGLYSVFLAEWLKLFPQEQFCMIDLESFKEGIDHGMRLIEGCLGLAPLASQYKKTSINTRGTRTGVRPMLKETRTLLQEMYEPYNRQLCELEIAPGGCKATWLTSLDGGQSPDR